MATLIYMKYRKTAVILKRIVRISDVIVFSVIVESCFIILLGNRMRHPLGIAASFLSILLSTALFEVRKSRAEAGKERERIRQELITEKILLMSDREVSDSLKDESFYFLRRQNPDRYELIHALGRKPKYLITVSKLQIPYSRLHTYSPKTTVLTALKFADLIHVSCTQTEIENRAEEKETYRFDRSRFRQLFSVRWNRYYVLGTLLLVMSFIVKHKIYYRTIASISLFLALIQGIFRSRALRNNSFSFLDKFDR